MQFRRIEIRDFRKLGQAGIDDIGDGLSVIVGDNEAGKSTVLAALRAVLFERHRVSGDVVRRMLPYGQNVRPEVAIEFDLKGAHWRLRKAFNQRQEAELVGPGERITGDAVEDRLAELFTFTPPGRGESKRNEHQGIYGLLWVEQGRSHHSLGVGGGRDTLASALEGEIGQVIGGDRGRALLSAATGRKEMLWGRNDKPRGDYRQLAEQIDQLQDRRTTLQESLRQHEAQVAALSAREEALARHKRDERLQKAIEAAQATKDALIRAQGFERAMEEAGLRLARCEKDRGFAAEHCQRRYEMIGKGEAAEIEVTKTRRSFDEARGLLERRQGVAEAAEKQHDAARRKRVQAEDKLRLLEVAVVRRRRMDALERDETQLMQAEAYAAAQREATAAAAAVSVGPEDIAELEKLQKAVEQAQSELKAASVQIAFEPEEGRTIVVDGVKQAEDAPLHLSRDAAIDLEGFGRLLVRPGGGVGPLARAADDAVRTLEDRLRKHGFADVSTARTAMTRKSEAEYRAAAQSKLLSALAPGGLDGLRQSVETERTALARPLPEAAAAPMAADAAMIEDAQRVRCEAVQSERWSEAAASDARSGREQAARELAVFGERATNAKTQFEARVTELAASRAQASDDLLRDRLRDAERASDTAEADLARVRAALEATDPAVARLDFERAERAERSIRADIDNLASEKRDLEVELGVLGRRGLGEELAEVEGRIERLGREKEAKDLEAAASRLLLQTLTDAQRESKDRWLGPVRERAKPYLRFLEPDSEIVLNEQTLEIEGIVRKGVNEPFDALSMGAREQVAVITRLALADILRASGRPSALILDDALVNTDESRLARMHRVLQTAAKSLQILVLTCRERDFVGLGDIKRL